MPAALPTHARVLIADGSVVGRGVLVILLENAGFDVISVNDGHQAMEALRAHAFDLAVLDHEMPNLDDLGAIAELRVTLPKLPVIVCASTLTPEQTARYRELGIDLLTKPVDPHTLRNQITGLLTPALKPAAGASAAPFRDLHSTAAAPVPSPLACGLSRFSRELKIELQRLREFRSVAILEGRLGSGRFELALSLAPEANAHKFVCHADDLDAAHLDLLFKPIAADTIPVFLVVLEAHRLDAAHQTFLSDLVSGRLPNYPSITKRLRLVLCAQTSLCELHFNELLLMRAVTSTVQIPDFKDRWMDWAEIARAILRRVGVGRSTFDPEAIAWINRQTWTGDYMQLHRTIELARRHAGVTSVLIAQHLEAAFAAEPACNEPLFHDLLFHVHSTADV
jgi:DNA-binding NtrC family response regulator